MEEELEVELTINQIIEYYAGASIQFADAFASRLEAKEKDRGRKTARDLCGIVIPLSGRAHFSFDGTVYRMDGRTIVHAGSAMDIEIETFDGPWEYIVLHYRLIDAVGQYKGMIHQHFELSVHDSSKIRQQALQLLKQQAKPDALSKFQSQVLFMDLIGNILQEARNDRYESKMEGIRDALEYIHQHYTEELFVSELAQKLGMERRRFSHLFERMTGLTPIQYLTEYRIGQAKELLRASSSPIVKIAEQVGYPDSFYFSRVFKKRVGMSPSNYRKIHGKNPYSEG